MAEVLGAGSIRKMKTSLGPPAQYRLPLGDSLIEMNPLIGETIKMNFDGEIHCIHCDRVTKKSFSQGYCFPCFKTLAECDMCIMRPETCHFAEGTCRDAEWAQGHCMQSHYVYIANSSGLKVGITRGDQLPTRWIDQGANQAIQIFRVKNRFHSGLLETTIKQYVSDRTDWRKMLKGGAESVDLKAAAQDIVDQASAGLTALSENHADLQWQTLDEPVTEISYPVEEYPTKVSSFNFDKTPEVGGVLRGIKGQYLILDGGVINMRKFSGYHISLARG
ncbi:MAG: DUF2797 domain-containing protein [Acidiferrobacterales bacterium]|nr:DUF2797 domain-containing protein [Acidiferrobacterales bacterium]